MLRNESAQRGKEKQDRRAVASHIMERVIFPFTFYLFTNESEKRERNA